MRSFAGRLVLVTGASSGLGEAIARRLAVAESADVIVAARRTNRLEQLADEIRSECGSRVYPVTVDLAGSDGPEMLVSQVREIEAGRRLAQDTGSEQAGRHPRLFGIVNNAGITSYGAFVQGDPERLEKVIRVNLAAPIRLTRLLLPSLVDRGEGAILNVTSLGAYLPVPYQAVYSATKHGLQAFTESLSGELAGTGVRVCAFAPAGVATEMISGSGLGRKFSSSSRLLADADVMATRAVHLWKRGRLSGLGGPASRLGALIGRLLPPTVTTRGAARIYRPSDE